MHPTIPARSTASRTSAYARTPNRRRPQTCRLGISRRRRVRREIAHSRAALRAFPRFRPRAQPRAASLPSRPAARAPETRPRSRRTGPGTCRRSSSVRPRRHGARCSRPRRPRSTGTGNSCSLRTLPAARPLARRWFVRRTPDAGRSVADLRRGPDGRAGRTPYSGMPAPARAAGRSCPARPRFLRSGRSTSSPGVSREAARRRRRHPLHAATARVVSAAAPLRSRVKGNAARGDRPGRRAAAPARPRTDCSRSYHG